MMRITKRRLKYMAGVLIVVLAIALPLMAGQPFSDGIGEEDAISVARDYAQQNGLQQEASVRAVPMLDGDLQALAGHGPQRGKAAMRKVWVVEFKGVVELNFPGAPTPPGLRPIVEDNMRDNIYVVVDRDTGDPFGVFSQKPGYPLVLPASQ